MQIIKVKDYEALSRKAADIIAAMITLQTDCVLGLATGSTPEGAYARLAEMNRDGDVDFSDVTTVNLDEYRGLDGSHDQSYRYFMNHHLFDLVNIDKDRTYVPDGLAEDVEEAGEAYEEIIDELGGIDLQLLGLGHNGHIGFNEPGDAFPLITHGVKLTESTIEANKRFFASADDVPREAITMGIGSIFKARTILLIASGEGKADILAEALYGPITPQVPASALQLHPDVIVIADKAAASRLPE